MIQLNTKWSNFSVKSSALLCQTYQLEQHGRFHGWTKLAVLQQKWHKDCLIWNNGLTRLQQQHANVLRRAQLSGEEEIGALTLSLAAGNCYLMKQMFCGIYNLVFMVMVSSFVISVFIFFSPSCKFYFNLPVFLSQKTNETICTGSLISSRLKFGGFVFPPCLCLARCPYFCQSSSVEAKVTFQISKLL